MITNNGSFNEYPLVERMTAMLFCHYLAPNNYEEVLTGCYPFNDLTKELYLKCRWSVMATLSKYIKMQDVGTRA